MDAVHLNKNAFHLPKMMCTARIEHLIKRRRDADGGDQRLKVGETNLSSAVTTEHCVESSNVFIVTAD